MDNNNRHYSPPTVAISDEDNVVSLLQNDVANEKQARSAINADWLQLWSLYKTRPLRITSDEGWQSRLNDGRVFELIETVGAYIRSAVFYSDSWANVEALEPGLAEVVPLVSAFFVDSLNNSNLKREFRLWLTQLLLLGYSGILPYWDEENESLAFECLNAYDVYVESSRRYDERFCFSFREVFLNEAEFISWAEDGFIDLSENYAEAFNRLAEDDDVSEAEKYNIRDTVPVADQKHVRLVEYYSAKERTFYRFACNELLYEEAMESPPWLLSFLFETPEDAYALSIINSSLGLILENNILLNRRLDNIAVSVDNMWLYVDDGVSNPDDFRTAPGKVLKVARPDTLIPLRPPSNNFSVTYQEAAVLDGKIDRNVGTGAMISANTYRSGERVTAQEIQSVKDAGGNRLTDVFEHIEATAIIPLLWRAFDLLKANISSSKVVRMPSAESGVNDFWKLEPDDLRYEYKIKIAGTQSVINRDRNIQQLTDFMTLVNTVPQFQQLTDYSNLFFDLLTKFGFDDPSRYMLKQSEEEAPAAPQAPLAAMQETAGEVGGLPMQQALQTKVAEGGAVDFANSMAGMSPEATPAEPNAEALALAALQTPV